ncbi:hypothetical protein P154DRAFT_539298 [Amniculicola lignicola CBS 123094]|uniref:Uncharacterized protein n=1 Tax=Amniculicola lignicola CBS 123094 TaxID=1392246 RepID=A0A6A5W3X9_9PLEO|nr:hypothetical protein P154DRAFT_539298 [Amniculicola lignicola CBS 123094]
MPPALSDYDSDNNIQLSPYNNNPQSSKLSQPASPERLLPGEEEAEPVVIEKTQKTRAISKKRKRPSLLQDITPDNIISSGGRDATSRHDTPPTSSLPTSSYRTRARTNRSSLKKLNYDQKYHPMDDVLNPGRAAKRKAQVPSYTLASEELSSSTFGEGSNSGSGSNMEGNGELNIKKQRNTLLPAFETPATRRSARQINTDVNYDSNVHPQDAELAELDNGQPKSEEREHEGLENVEDGDAVHTTPEEIRDTYSEDQVVSYEETDTQGRVAGQDDRRKDSGTATALDMNVQSSVIKASLALQAAIQSTVQSTIQTRLLFGLEEAARADEPRPRRSLEQPLSSGGAYTQAVGAPFVIYEEPLHVQLAHEAAAPPPEIFDDDDKENHFEFSDTESRLDALDGISVMPPTGSQNQSGIQAQGQGEETQQDEEHLDSEWDSVMGDYHVDEYHSSYQTEAANNDEEDVLTEYGADGHVDDSDLGEDAQGIPNQHADPQWAPLSQAIPQARLPRRVHTRVILGELPVPIDGEAGYMTPDEDEDD